MTATLLQSHGEHKIGRRVSREHWRWVEIFHARGYADPKGLCDGNYIGATSTTVLLGFGVEGFCPYHLRCCGALGPCAYYYGHRSLQVSSACVLKECVQALSLSEFMPANPNSRLSAVNTIIPFVRLFQFPNS